MTFAKRHLVRIQEQVAHLDGAIAADERRGATPSRKLGLRSALKGVLVAAEEYLALRRQVQQLEADLAEARDLLGTSESLKDFHEQRDVETTAVLKELLPIAVERMDWLHGEYPDVLRDSNNVLLRLRAMEALE